MAEAVDRSRIDPVDPLIDGLMDAAAYATFVMSELHLYMGSAYREESDEDVEKEMAAMEREQNEEWMDDDPFADEVTIQMVPSL